MSAELPGPRIGASHSRDTRDLGTGKGINAVWRLRQSCKPVSLESLRTDPTQESRQIKRKTVPSRAPGTRSPASTVMASPDASKPTERRSSGSG